MKRYIGTKIVFARPMSRQQYNDYRGWTLPANENGDDPGYLVEYQNGSVPNHALHTGYISWSPADQFNQAHHAVPDAIYLAPHQQRVVDEKFELDTKIAALEDFLTNNAMFKKLDGGEQNRLVHQAVVMATYSDILGERIAAF
jgi:hypothetical protein